MTTDKKTTTEYTLNLFRKSLNKSQEKSKSPSRSNSSSSETEKKEGGMAESFLNRFRKSPKSNESVTSDANSPLVPEPEIDSDSELDGVFLWSKDETEEELEQNDAFVNQDVRDYIDSKPDLTDEEKIIIQRLSMKAFHLPGNTYWQDWHMFVQNNHIVFSFCLAHPLHPFGRRERILNLVASLAFGLSATSLVVLWYAFSGRDFNKTVISIFGQPILSQGMLVTSMCGICNVVFDFLMWFIQVCPLCQPGSPVTFSEKTNSFCLWLGSKSAFIIAAIAVSLAVNVCIYRASMQEDGDYQGLSTKLEHYSFFLHFCVQVTITQFVMFPIVAFTIFSGVLGCFTLPGIGGRPYQKKKMKRRLRSLRMASGPAEF